MIGGRSRGPPRSGSRVRAAEGGTGVSPNYITDEVTALIGMESAPVEATHPVEASEVRRFQQATMDEAPRYWEACHGGSGTGGDE